MTRHSYNTHPSPKSPFNISLNHVEYAKDPESVHSMKPNSIGERSHGGSIHAEMKKRMIQETPPVDDGLAAEFESMGAMIVRLMLAYRV